MTRPYSMDLRERMVRAVKAGASRRAIAARFGVSPSCVIKLMQRWQRAGTFRARAGARRRSTRIRRAPARGSTWATARI
jgi:transposase